MVQFNSWTNTLTQIAVFGSRRACNSHARRHTAAFYRSGARGDPHRVPCVLRRWEKFSINVSLNFWAFVEIRLQREMTWVKSSNLRAKRPAPGSWLGASCRWPRSTATWRTGPSSKLSAVCECRSPKLVLRSTTRASKTWPLKCSSTQTNFSDWRYIRKLYVTWIISEINLHTREGLWEMSVQGNSISKKEIN